MKKIIIIFILTIISFSYTYAEIDLNCFLSKQIIKTDNKDISIQAKENDLYAFTLSWEILKLLSYWNYKKNFYSYYIMDKTLPVWNIKDNNKKSFFEFNNLYHNEYRFTIRFDYTLLANSFDYELLTNNNNYKMEISKDNHKWKEISKYELLKENINYIRFTFLREKDKKTKKYITPKEPIKIYHLKFFNKWNYEYLFQNNIEQEITIYKDYICDRNRLLKEAQKIKYNYNNKQDF